MIAPNARPPERPTARPWSRLAGVAIAALALLTLGIASPRPAAAELRIDITRGVTEALPLAVVDFQGDGAKAGDVGHNIAGVISADLERSGLFAPIDPKVFIQAQPSMDSEPRFGDWRIINAQALLYGRVKMLDDGRLRVEFRLWDVFAQKQMAGLAYYTTPENWRRIAHIIADSVYKRVTGEDGYFDTRIVYVAESGPQVRRVKRLAIMDQDGANHRFLTDGSALVLTPRFSPTLQEIAYLSYSGGAPSVYIRNIDTQREERVGDFAGMTFAPRFSPDGEKLVMSMAKDGNSEIYTIDLRTRITKRLTNSSAIDTSPSYSPDGRQIVLNSDRGGSQQLYVMDADGTNVRRISHGEGRYFTPVWSPRGDLIAFTRISGGRFAIGVMRPDGSGERILSEGFHVEGPTWAPNGRVLMYFKKDTTGADGSGGKSRLYSIDLTGYNQREIVTPLDASDPAWSPLHP